MGEKEGGPNGRGCTPEALGKGGIGQDGHGFPRDSLPVGRYLIQGHRLQRADLQCIFHERNTIAQGWGPANLLRKGGFKGIQS